MNRHAVVISNPGEVGEDNYCKGVFKDVENYKSFLLRAGGAALDLLRRLPLGAARFD